ncbi:MAG: hypothetical protein HRU15_11315, partial [Planctomycetes bacterium]|nr:hypothetical protein [Planctomycetota bacterium]
MSGSCNIQVLESGPVRAQISVHIQNSNGDCRLSYQLYAHEDFIHVSVHWSNRKKPMVIDHSTSYRRAPMECAGELSPWFIEQSARYDQPKEKVQIGCHWARLHEHHSPRGLAVSSEWPLAVSAQGGHLRVHNTSSVRYALSSGVSEKFGNPGRISQHCSLPGRALAAQADQAAAFFLSESKHLVPIWIRHVGNNMIELLLSEQDGHRGKAFLYPVARALAVAQRVDALGNELRPLNLTKEEDGFEVDYQPYEVFIIRWTVE